MPATTENQPFDAIDNYLPDDFDDPFASPPQSPNANAKRKEPDGGLGIDEEISVAKRARVPRVKLDEGRLLSDKGIPALRKRAANLKLKGKGHEFSDAARLLSFYQLWLDDLFPKAKFLDALAMVEKAGHKTTMHKRRTDWINELKPKPASADWDDGSGGAQKGGDDGAAAADDDEAETAQKTRQPTTTRIAPIFEKRPPQPMTTSSTAANIDALFGDVPDDDEDLYDVTPPPPPTSTGRTTRPAASGGEPDDDDDLDALMAEAEAETQMQASRPRRPSASGSTGTMAPPASAAPVQPVRSLFGDGKPSVSGSGTSVAGTNAGGRGVVHAENDEDDLDAMIAEAEAEAEAQRGTAGGNAKVNMEKRTAQTVDVNEEDELEALMAEAEAAA